jgi:hypothetical protein
MGVAMGRQERFEVTAIGRCRKSRSLCRTVAVSMRSCAGLRTHSSIHRVPDWVVWSHTTAPGRGFGDMLAVAGSQWDGSDGAAERLGGEVAAAAPGPGCEGSARG